MLLAIIPLADRENSLPLFPKFSHSQRYNHLSISTSVVMWPNISCSNLTYLSYNKVVITG